jgi:hypothetical protein
MSEQQAEPKQSKYVSSLPNTVNTIQAAELIGMTELRLKTLVREGRGPAGAQKDEKGHWRFTPAAVKEWAANRPARKGGGGDGRRKAYVRVNDEEFQVVSAALKSTGLELKYANKPKPKGEQAEQPAVNVPATPVGRNVPQQGQPGRPQGR